MASASCSTPIICGGTPTSWPGSRGQEREFDALHVLGLAVPTRDLLLDRGMMGDGVIDLPAFRQAAEDAGYGGPVEVEIFSAADWWQRDPDTVLSTCQARLDRL